MSSEGCGACLGEGLHYCGILPGVCKHSKQQRNECKPRPLVLWDARVVGERQLAKEGSLVFAAMSGLWFSSPKMSPVTILECSHDYCTFYIFAVVMCGGARTNQKVLYSLSLSF